MKNHSVSIIGLVQKSVAPPDFLLWPRCCFANVYLDATYIRPASACCGYIDAVDTYKLHFGTHENTRIAT